MNKIKISSFNKLIISSIVILFSFLFYLSVPALYDYERVQKHIKSELLSKFNLNIEISKKIKYRILPSPHFEIIDSKLYSNSQSDPKLIGDLKNSKIFVSINNLHNQKYLNIKDVEFSRSIFNFNKKNIHFLNDNFKIKKSDRNISIKKSKFFFREKDKTIAIFPINNLKFFYNEKKLINVVDLNGIAFNSKFTFNIIKEFEKEKKINFVLKLPAANLSVKNVLSNISNEENKFNSLTIVNFLGSEIKTQSDFSNNLLKFSSKKSKVLNNNLKYSGLINFKPFYFNTNINIENWNWVKILSNNFFVSVLLQDNFKIHSNFSSKILVNIDSFFKSKIFKNGKLYIETQNGKINFNNSYINLKDFGRVTFTNSSLFSFQGSTIFKSNILLNISKNRKFYNAFQVPKNNRKKFNQISFTIENNLSEKTTKISNIIIDSKPKKNLAEKINFIINNSEFSLIENTSNWIESKSFINELIKEINSV